MINHLIKYIQPFVEQEIKSISTPYGELIEVEKGLNLHVVLLNNIQNKKDNVALAEFNSVQQLKKGQFICVYEDELSNKFEIILSRIKSLLGISTRIHGRSTKVVKLTKPELLNFLDQNHGNEPFNAKYKYGLTYKGELVAVASFGQLMHKKFEAGGKWSGELIRFCNKSDYTVVGGLSKLIKHFIKQHKVDDVMTYVDKNWSDGKSYLKLGFKLVDELPQVEFFVDSQTLVRYNHKTKKETKNSLISVFTSGSLKFILTVNNGK